MAVNSLDYNKLLSVGPFLMIVKKIFVKTLFGKTSDLIFKVK